MASNQPPQVGFNNNVQYRGRVFHIQTEDAGVKRTHITSLLFADGGHIVKSERTDYRELLGAQDLAERLRTKMREQHRAMFDALRAGQLDELLERLFAGELEPSGSDALPLSANSAALLREMDSGGQAHFQVRVTSEQEDGRGGRPASRSGRSQSLAAASMGQCGAPCSVAPAERESIAPPPRSPEIGSCKDAAERLKTGSGIPAVKRPATPLGSVTPDSLFGLHPSCEQSLDDVILSYISEGSAAANRPGE